MTNVPFEYTPLFSLGEDTTQYRCISKEGIRIKEFEGREMLIVDKEAIRLLTNTCIHDVSFFLRPKHLKQWADALKDPEATENDKTVIRALFENAIIASHQILPLCQDTGTAICHGHKGENVLVEGNDEEAISKGVYDTYINDNLRYSQNAPLSMYEEINTKCNLPAQIDIHSDKGNEYKFLFCVKGGGSANKSYLFQETRAVLTPSKLIDFIVTKMKTLGTAACPPYHLAVVIGGTSAEKNLETVKLASTGYYDSLPTTGNKGGRAYRDLDMEKLLLQKAQETGIGAQYGGKYFALDVKVIRMPRHGASCPIGIGVSCSADRNIKGKITKDGIFVEELEHNPEQYLCGLTHDISKEPTRINLDVPMPEILKQLTVLPVESPVLLSGTIIVARDIAHARINDILKETGDVPQYIKDHPIYYAGPAKQPKGYPSGSFGPTTSARMDPYVDDFQAHGGSLVMIAKGNRSEMLTNACKKHGGFYLGAIGGAAALLAEKNIKSVECIAFEDLGMEAVWKIKVEDLLAFVLVDDKGNDFFKQIKPFCSSCSKKCCCETK
ncbi:fumarate hydratase class I, anaerobic, putative [Entamoeba dispar SAW760]|uniref:fumarate hydratase n=1 Tax=Entamoeba dispar (strain ATCC PRA-260 / SAW760) TaxID=370354 RepID=B0E8A9_ENTDS|nr:fumarate hydratase class I, anaerobic, putative [Entamoeba dispar SAW760]EDR29234.1 fumarate hydratase class I, anaerobic, putative [Entamoeba dispar SAW760]|eukprot:EDR29234.1 fumarate hydratase class I, anaerobic, putative [Entamoeba dispar SAW760]